MASQMTGQMPNRTVHLLGRRLTMMTVPAIVDSISQAIAQDRKITIGHYNVHGFNLSMQLPWFHSFLQAADISHCDGMGIIKALSFLGLDLPQQYRVSYSLLMPALLQECDRQGLKMFLLGAKPQYLSAALSNLRKQYPNAQFAGQHGYFPRHDPQANGQVIDAINAAQPDILLVGMGMPIQEEWVLHHREQINVNAILVGGAIIDRLAGEVSDCPSLLSNMGVEWAYRLMREPRRLGARYLLGNPAFVCQILLAKLLGIQDALETDEVTLQAAAQALAAASQLPQKRLGEYLVEAGLLTPQHIRQALMEQRHSGLRLGEILVSQGCLREATVEFIVAHSALENRLSAGPGKGLISPKAGAFAGAGLPKAEPRLLRPGAPQGDAKRLGEYLVEAGLSSPQTIRRALELQRGSQQRLGEILVDQGAVQPETVEFMVTYFHGDPRAATNLGQTTARPMEPRAVS
jgi:N-acetylglucosaminyldiphosphoundecaprenol N-acetyl-beta-D-mannosaminyltransferase